MDSILREVIELGKVGKQDISQLGQANEVSELGKAGRLVKWQQKLQYNVCKELGKGGRLINLLQLPVQSR